MSVIHRFPWASRDDAQIWIVHFGSKSTPLIAQLCREIGFVSRVVNAKDFPAAWMRTPHFPKLVILSGGDQSVYDADAPTLDPNLLLQMHGVDTVVLGICYGAQLLAKLAGGEVRKAERAEYGEMRIQSRKAFGEYRGGSAIMNHQDEITRLPNGWRVFGTTERCAHAFIASADERLIGVQFHPEMDHTDNGQEILEHAAIVLAGCKKDYLFDAAYFLTAARAWMREICAGTPVVCGLSGGVDSAVAFVLARGANLPELRGIFVDTGWMRKNEAAEVRRWFGMENITYVDAGGAFTDAIELVPYPEEGTIPTREGRYYADIRKTIGAQFIRTFEGEVHQHGLDGMQPFLIQGTNAADVIESDTGLKAHHNVGALPEHRPPIIEPLAGLYKTEIRRLATYLVLPEDVVYRQPFPGPGLALRAYGKLSREIIAPLQDANEILEELVRKHYPRRSERPCQYFVAFCPYGGVGLMGDARVDGHAWHVRMVWAKKRESYSTVSVEPLPPAFQQELAHRLTSETQMPDGTRFTRVFYEITGKPPSTTELH